VATDQVATTCRTGGCLLTDKPSRYDQHRNQLSLSSLRGR